MGNIIQKRASDANPTKTQSKGIQQYGYEEAVAQLTKVVTDEDKRDRMIQLVVKEGDGQKAQCMADFLHMVNKPDGSRNLTATRLLGFGKK